MLVLSIATQSINQIRKTSASGSIKQLATWKVFFLSGSDFSQLCEKERKIFSTMRKAITLSAQNHAESLA